MKYLVSVPITGVISVEVEAEDENQATALAFESDTLNLDNVDEWEAHDYIVKGNVFYGIMNEVKVELVDAEDD